MNLKLEVNMDISTRRFHIKQEHGVTTVRDMNAPYHLHTVPTDKIPSVEHLAKITEDQFNNLLNKLVYSK